jgi:aminoglycoside phosphotransferase (APT) family kinase protein
MEGIAEERVGPWLAEHVGLREPIGYELIAGGRSNLTYRVSDAGGRKVVLRRPPAHHVLPTAHDMVREHSVISALQGTPVPVPGALALCTDADVTGAPFYVMSYVEGHVLRDPETAAAVLDLKARRRTGDRLAEVLASLHALEPAAVGLGDLGRQQGYIARQLERWHHQFDKTQVEGSERVEAIDKLYQWLGERIPPQHGVSVVHGDYRLDNTLLKSSGDVAAVLDWEICTLGDPLADVGMLMVYWSEPSDSFSVLGTSPTLAAGFPTRADVLSRYGEASGRDASDLDFYVAFAYWKLACILQGVLCRYAAGAAAGDRSGTGTFGPMLHALAEAALQAGARL